MTTDTIGQASGGAAALFRQGRLGEALAAQAARVRERPQDAAARGFLAQLHCHAGNWQKAEAHLDLLGRMSPESMPGVALTRQLIQAAQEREGVFRRGHVPGFLGEPAPPLREALRAVALLRAGDPAGAAGAAALAQPAARPGTRDGKPFDEARDLDDVLAGVLEVMTPTGRYLWAALDQVERLAVQAPRSPRDRLWARAEVALAGGPGGTVYLPALYPWETPADTLASVGGETTWIDGPPVLGRGQRTFLVGEEAVGLHELGTLAFGAGGP